MEAALEAERLWSTRDRLNALHRAKLRVWCGIVSVSERRARSPRKTCQEKNEGARPGRLRQRPQSRRARRGFLPPERERSMRPSPVQACDRCCPNVRGLYVLWREQSPLEMLAALRAEQCHPMADTLPLPENEDETKMPLPSWWRLPYDPGQNPHLRSQAERRSFTGIGAASCSYRDVRRRDTIGGHSVAPH